MVEPGKYKNVTDQKIKEDLEGLGYKPLLITENPNDFLANHKHKESHMIEF